MRRASLVLTSFLVVTAVAVAQQTPPKLGATLAACQAGAEPDQRFAVFIGSMPALRGTKHMSMRFDLEERRSDTSRFRRIAAAKFGRWDRAKTGAAGFVYTKRVTRLAQGRWYRATVRFKWQDATGKVQRTARRATVACHQPDQRPNLQVESVHAARSSGAEMRYLVTVVNAGLTAAAESTVTLDVAGDPSRLRAVPPLAPGEKTTGVIETTRCAPGSTVVAKADAFAQVDESREDDNRLDAPCPEP